MTFDPSRSTEKLIILLDYSEGVLARLYHATQFQPRKQLSNLPTDVAKHLLRHIADPAEGIWQLPSMAALRSKREQIADETRFVFNVFQDLLDAINEISGLIKEVTNNILKFEIDVNGDIAVRTFDLLTNFTKMILLAARISDIGRLAVLMHSVCSQDAAMQVRKLLHDLRSPYRFIRGSVNKASGMAFATCLSQPTVSMSVWMDSNALKALELFSWDPPTKLAMPFESLPDHTKQVLNDAQHIKDIGVWIFTLCVTYPHMLNFPEMKQLLDLTIKDRYYDILFRDERIDFKQEIIKAAKDYAFQLKKQRFDSGSNPSDAQLIDINALTKSLQSKSARSTKLENRHLQTQIWLTLGLKDLLYTFAEVPGAIAPKLPIVIGILHKIKHEILWTVVHCSSSKVDDFGVTKFWRKFCHFPELLENSCLLSNMVLKYQDLIYDYYAEIMKTHVFAVCKEYGKVKGELDHPTVVLMEGLLNKLMENQNMKDVRLKQYSHVRLDCYRLQYHLTNIQLFSSIKRQSGREWITALLKKLKKLSDDSRFAETLETELKHCNPLRMLWYYPKSLRALFNVLLSNHTVHDVAELEEMGYGVKASRNISRYWSVFIRVFEYAVHNVHHEFGNEQKDIGNYAIQSCEDYLKLAGDKVIECLNVIFSEEGRLSRQIGTTRLAKDLISGKKKDRYPPGSESFQTKYRYQEQLTKLNQAMVMLIDIIHGFRNMDSVLIYDQRIYPNAYLRKAITKWVLHVLRGGFEIKENSIPHRQNKSIQLGFLQPNKLKMRVEAIFGTLSRLDQALNLEMQPIIKEILTREFTITKLEPQLKLKQKSGKEDEGKLITFVCRYYVTLLEHAYVDGSSGNKLKAVYSTNAKSWITSIEGDAVGNALQTFCSETELTTLISIIGPHGVRALDHAILKQIAQSVLELQQTMQNKKFEKVYRRVCKHGVNDLKDVHFLMTNVEAKKLIHIINRHGMRIGAFVQFRKLLKMALHRACDQRALFESDTIGLLQNSIHPMNCKEALRELLNSMISRFGIDDDGSSIFEELRNMFSTKDKKQNELMSHLPDFMSVCMLSQDFWNRNGNGRYQVDLANFSNNGVALADAVHFLFDVFTDSNSTLKQAVIDKKRNWLKTASYIASELVNCTKNMEENAMAFVKYIHGSELVLFLYHFVDLDPVHLNKSDLDELFMYDVIRAEMVRVYGENSSSTTSHVYVDAQERETGDEISETNSRKSHSFSNAK